VASSYLLAFLASLALSLVLTRYVRNFAVARGWVDVQDSGRHTHRRLVPRLGGVALFLSVASVVCIDYLSRRLLGLPERLSIETVVGLLGPATLIFVSGLYDDLRGLGPYAKFGFQILAAVLLYLAGFGIHNVDLLFPWHALRGFVALPLTIFWVVLITNAFNLIDGLDGLAAGSVLFSTLVVFVISLFTANTLVSFLTIVLAGATLGFLRFNFNPATIFLGDCGSLFIGFMLSALSLAGSQKAPTMVAVAIPVVSCGLPILDVAIAVVRRFLSGKPLFRGDLEHIHHKLLKRGLSHREAVLILYGVSAVFGLLSLALLHGGATIGLLLVILGVGVCFGVQQLKYLEFAELWRVVHRAASQKRIIANDLNIRRATESLTTCSDASALCRILTEALQPLGFDGFSFQLAEAMCIPESSMASLTRIPDRGFGRCWTVGSSLEPSWELQLKLVTGAGENCGLFCIQKRLAGEPLYVDINLLTEGFQLALADALHRAVMEAGASMEDRRSVAASRKALVASASSSSGR
jgi:UDP-GlcNAc:undecaprenyl-phosphate/decaprenyl-phosphate GlcNAc-1-phosphate transferase